MDSLTNLKEIISQSFDNELLQKRFKSLGQAIPELIMFQNHSFNPAVVKDWTSAELTLNFTQLSLLLRQDSSSFILMCEPISIDKFELKTELDDILTINHSSANINQLYMKPHELQVSKNVNAIARLCALRVSSDNTWKDPLKIYRIYAVVDINSKFNQLLIFHNESVSDLYSNLYDFEMLLSSQKPFDASISVGPSKIQSILPVQKPAALKNQDIPHGISFELSSSSQSSLSIISKKMNRVASPKKEIPKDLMDPLHLFGSVTIPDRIEGMFWCAGTQFNINTLFFTNTGHVTSSFPIPGRLSTFGGETIEKIIESNVYVQGLIGTYQFLDDELYINWIKTLFLECPDFLCKAYCPNKNQIKFLHRSGEDIFNRGMPFDSKRIFINGLFVSVLESSVYIKFKMNGICEISFPLIQESFYDHSPASTFNYSIDYFTLELRKIVEQSQTEVVQSFSICKTGINNDVWIEGFIFMQSGDNSHLQLEDRNGPRHVIPQDYTSNPAINMSPLSLSINLQPTGFTYSTINTPRLQNQQQIGVSQYPHQYTGGVSPLMNTFLIQGKHVQQSGDLIVTKTSNSSSQYPYQQINSNTAMLNPVSPIPRLFSLGSFNSDQIEGLFIGVQKNLEKTKWLSLNLIFVADKALVLGSIPMRGALSTTTGDKLFAQIKCLSTPSPCLSGVYNMNPNRTYQITWGKSPLAKEYASAIPSSSISSFALLENGKVIFFTASQFNTSEPLILRKVRAFPYTGMFIKAIYAKNTPSNPEYLQFLENGTIYISEPAILAQFGTLPVEPMQFVYSLGHFSLEIRNGPSSVVAFTVYMPGADDSIIIIENIPYFKRS